MLVNIAEPEFLYFLGNFRRVPWKPLPYVCICPKERDSGEALRLQK